MPALVETFGALVVDTGFSARRRTPPGGVLEVAGRIEEVRCKGFDGRIGTRLIEVKHMPEISFAERNLANLHVVRVTEANFTDVAIDMNGRPRPTSKG